VDDHQEEPVNLNKYAAKIHETAASHGFWPEDDKQQVVDAFNRICLDVIDGSSSESGGDIELVRNFIQAHEVRNMGEMLMLATSELAEALEEHRDGNPVHYYSYIHSPALSGTGLDFSVMGPDELDRLSIKKKPEGLAVELADCVIRCLDTLHSLGVDIDGIVQEKMAYNSTRPHKHGKGY
jgi:hypothetical protein